MNTGRGIRGGMKKSDEEYHIQVAIAEFMRLEYPDVIFRSDLSGIKLSIGQAMKIKRVQGEKAYPDFTILQACRGWHGMMLEIKKDYNEIHRKDGTFRQDKHTQEQIEMLLRLREKGYYAIFGCGYEASIKLVKAYLG